MVLSYFAMWQAPVRWLVKSLGGSAALLLAGACAPTMATKTAVSPVSGAPSYKIECVHVAECLAEAKRTCNGKFDTVSTRENVNTIPESELPGLNSQSQANTFRHTTSYGTTIPGGIAPYGPGIESDEPMPIAEIVVACR
jgi:hypothetical protein